MTPDAVFGSPPYRRKYAKAEAEAGRLLVETERLRAERDEAVFLLGEAQKEIRGLLYLRVAAFLRNVNRPAQKEPPCDV